MQTDEFTRLSSPNQDMPNQIKQVIENAIQAQLNTREPITLPSLISQELQLDYAALSALFLASQAVSLDAYISVRKLDKVKELLVYTDQSLDAIAALLNYDSPDYLSNELERLTGFTAAYYKQIRRDKLMLQKNLLAKNK